MDIVVFGLFIAPPIAAALILVWPVLSLSMLGVAMIWFGVYVLGKAGEGGPLGAIAGAAPAMVIVVGGILCLALAGLAALLGRPRSPAL